MDTTYRLCPLEPPGWLRRPKAGSREGLAKPAVRHSHSRGAAVLPGRTKGKKRQLEEEQRHSLRRICFGQRGPGFPFSRLRAISY